MKEVVVEGKQWQYSGGGGGRPMATVVVVVEGKQWHYSGGGGGKTMAI